jgi:predicted NBD/HSP70 family sugar kinase
MEFFSGLDMGMDETAICVVDDKGKVALQVTVVTDPDDQTCAQTVSRPASAGGS